MALFDDLPDPRDQLPAESSGGRPIDRRKEFEELVDTAADGTNAERAFLENKIELVRVDPHLSDDDRARAMADLQRRSRFLSDHKQSSRK
jgi:hypothetical protein